MLDFMRFSRIRNVAKNLSVSNAIEVPKNLSVSNAIELICD